MKCKIDSVLFGVYEILNAEGRKPFAAALGISRHRLRGAISEYRARERKEAEHE